MKNIFYREAHVEDNEGRVKINRELENFESHTFGANADNYETSTFNTAMATSVSRKSKGKFYLTLIEYKSSSVVASVTEFETADDIIDFLKHTMGHHGVTTQSIVEDFAQLNWV